MFVSLSVHILLKAVAQVEILAEVWRPGIWVGQPRKDKQYSVRGMSFVSLARILHVRQWPKAVVAYDPAGWLGTSGEASQKLGS